ncbi:MAG: hypothetical protein WCT99_02485 [Bacteroidota bacterium]|jgi:YbbR domain-containing protein
MKEKKLPIFFFSLLFAFFVWVSVDLGNEFQITLDVPVRIDNLQPAKAIASSIPQSVQVKIQGTGWQLLNTIISPNIRYAIDFSNLSKRDTLFTYKNLNERISFPHGIHIFAIYPESVLVMLDTKISKTIPIEPDVRVSYRRGFDIVGEVRSSPDSITISGARSLLNTITQWRTKPVLLTDINAPAKISAELIDTLQLEISRPRISPVIEFDVQPIAEKTITDIPIDISQVPSNRTIVLIPPKMSIIIRSGVNTIAALTEKDFHISVDYTAILLDTSGMVQPTIHVPKNVTVVQREPDRIQYVVRK